MQLSSSRRQYIYEDIEANDLSVEAKAKNFNDVLKDSTSDIGHNCPKLDFEVCLNKDYC